VDLDLTNGSLFDQLTQLDLVSLRHVFDRLTTEIAELAEKEKELSEQREVLERRRAVVDSIGRFIAAERPPAIIDRSVLELGPSVPEAVQRILDASPSARWEAEEVHRELDEAGIDSTRENVRVALQRLFHAGKARRVGRGIYQSALAEPERGLLGEVGEDEG
jgi:hypothetical protein